MLPKSSLEDRLTSEAQETRLPEIQRQKRAITQSATVCKTMQIIRRRLIENQAKKMPPAASRRPGAKFAGELADS